MEFSKPLEGSPWGTVQWPMGSKLVILHIYKLEIYSQFLKHKLLRLVTRYLPFQEDVSVHLISDTPAIVPRYLRFHEDVSVHLISDTSAILSAENNSKWLSQGDTIQCGIPFVFQIIPES